MVVAVVRCCCCSVSHDDDDDDDDTGHGDGAIFTKRTHVGNIPVFLSSMCVGVFVRVAAYVLNIEHQSSIHKITMMMDRSNRFFSLIDS